MTPCVIHHRFLNSFVGRFLLCGVDGRIHVKTARINIALVLLVQHLSNDFGDVIRMGRQLIATLMNTHRFAHGFLILFLRNVIEIQHAFEHMFLSSFCALKISNRIIRRRRFGEPSQHSSFCQADSAQVFPEIHISGACKSISTLP